MHKQEEHEKLEAEMTRLGLPGKRRSDARIRADVVGVPVNSMKNWTAGRSRVPQWLWGWLKLWERAGAEVREEHKEWARDRADRGDYSPD